VIRALVGLIAIAAIAGVLVEDDAGTQSGRTPPATRDPVTTPSPAVEPRAINRQDRTSAAHRRREARVFDSRRLLTALPLERDGVRFDIAGLDRDGRTTVLSVAAGGRSRKSSRAVYRRVLRAYGDSGADYRLRWQR
jgi:hypothetical protein